LDGEFPPLVGSWPFQIAPEGLRIEGRRAGVQSPEDIPDEEKIGD